MNLVHTTTLNISKFSSLPSFRKPVRNPAQRVFFTVRSSFVSFPIERAKYQRELEAAVDVVERACRLCVDVKASLFASDGRIVEKNDQTPVTVADFGVQALVSLELGKLFPSIPLVAEEDSSFVRLNNLVDLVVKEVVDKASSGDMSIKDADVLEAIDRGGNNASVFGARPATYWVLDPIDGTRGFLKGTDALYVVGLALVVEGEIVLGIMGCPNWPEDVSDESTNKLGVLMVSHAGCGTWSKRLPNTLSGSANLSDNWIQCFVDPERIVHEASFCISDSQTWDSLPLSGLFNASIDADISGDTEPLLLPVCCGSLCKYLMVASGRATVFILQTRVEKIIKVWDHAVGVICVLEAGGKVTDWEGSELNLAADEVERRALYPSGGILVSNGNLHNHILETLSYRSLARL